MRVRGPVPLASSWASASSAKRDFRQALKGVALILYVVKCRHQRSSVVCDEDLRNRILDVQAMQVPPRMYVRLRVVYRIAVGIFGNSPAVGSRALRSAFCNN